ncbi:MAG TPA: carboxypeptidase-like regulatory domain-containing protein [Mucilaginibacter sp.]
MHELELRALDDPFLADALEGFEHAPTDQQANLAELTDRLHQRTEKKVRKIIPWIPLSAAASILIVLSAGIWFFANRGDKTEAKRVVAQDVVAKKQETPASSNSAVAADTLKVEKDKSIAKTAAPEAKAARVVKINPKATAQYNKATELNESAPVVSDESVAKANAPAAVDQSANSDKLKDVYEYGYASPKKDSIGANDMLVSDISKKKASTSAAKHKGLPSTATLLQSRVDGVNVNPDDSHTITGTVVGDGGMPITGATVKVQGRNFGAVTDANGKFTLQDVPKGQTISVNYIGYSGKKVKADQDSMRISLDPANSSLAEVVVTKETETTAQNAHPRDGWKSYNDYLDKNAQSPDGKTGKEKVSFTVAPDGSLSQFKVVKSLSADADKKAIALISAGPAWVGNADGKAKEVTVTVKFH